MTNVGPTLETPRLILRVPRAEDFDAFEALVLAGCISSPNQRANRRAAHDVGNDARALQRIDQRQHLAAGDAERERRHEAAAALWPEASDCRERSRLEDALEQLLELIKFP